MKAKIFYAFGRTPCQDIQPLSKSIKKKCWQTFLIDAREHNSWQAAIQWTLNVSYWRGCEGEEKIKLEKKFHIIVFGQFAWNNMDMIFVHSFGITWKQYCRQSRKKYIYIWEFLGFISSSDRINGDFFFAFKYFFTELLRYIYTYERYKVKAFSKWGQLGNRVEVFQPLNTPTRWATIFNACATIWSFEKNQCNEKETITFAQQSIAFSTTTNKPHTTLHKIIEFNKLSCTNFMKYCLMTCSLNVNSSFYFCSYKCEYNKNKICAGWLALIFQSSRQRLL